MAAAQDPGPDGGKAQSATGRFVRAGMELVGLGAGEDEIAVMEAVDAAYRPAIEALLAAELDWIEPEPGAELGREPRSVHTR